MRTPLTRQDLVDELAEARRSAHLSIRRAASLAKVPPSTAQGWFEGRHLPTPALMPNFALLLDALGLIADDDDRARWQQAIANLRSGEITKDSPYVGLRSYSVAEANLYVGRERAYAALLAAVARSQLVMVVGESGAGKSSLINAGLVGQGCGPGGPLAHLTALCVTVAEVPGLRWPSQPTLLVIDQFEEVEQLSAAQRTQVFDALAGLPAHVTCVIALAARSFGTVLRDERLAAQADAPVLLGPLATAEFTRIIEEPARMHGRAVSPELVQLALADLHLYGEPAAGTVLPLLSSALRRTWLHAAGQTLEAADYTATGGLWSALDDEAEAVYTALSLKQRAAARRLILAMVQFDGEQVVRRAVAYPAADAQLAAVADSFLSSRLFTRTGGQLRLSHDALLAHWGRLRGWIEDERASLVIARRIQLAAQLWDEGGRAKESLLPVEAEAWQNWVTTEGSPLLAPLENEFIAASLALADEQLRAQDAALAAMRRRTNAAITAAVVAVIMVAVTAGLGIAANRYRLTAEDATVTAQSRQLALIADELRELAPNTAGQLSVAAYAMTQTVATRSAVVTSAGQPMPTQATGPASNTMVAYSAAADLIVRADSAGDLTIWPGSDLAAEPATYASGGGQLFTLSLFTQQGRTLALVGGQQTAAVWDLTGEPVKLGEFGTDTVTYSAAWYDGVAYFGTLSGEVLRIDTTNPDQLQALTSLDVGEELAVSALAATPHGVYAGGRRDAVLVFDSTGSVTTTLAVEGTALALSASDDGAELLVGGSLNAVTEYTTEFEQIATYPERNVVVSLDTVRSQILTGGTGGTTSLWSNASETTLLTAAADVVIYDLLNGDDVVLVGTSAGAQVMQADSGGWSEIPIATPEDGSTYTYYYDISADGSVLINQTTAGDLITLDRGTTGYRISDSLAGQSEIVSLAVSATGKYLALGYRGQANYHLYERSGAGWEFLAEIEAWPSALAFSPDEQYLAAMSLDGSGAVIWELGGAQPEAIGELTLPNGATVTRLSYSAGGELAVGEVQGEISIYSLKDPAAPTYLYQLKDARSSLSQVTYSRDGTRLLAATREGQLWVWDVTAGYTLDLNLTPGDGAVSGAVWYDGQLLTAAENTVTAWPDDADSAAQLLCTRFGDRLTEDEWDRLASDVPQLDGCTQLATEP